MSAFPAGRLDDLLAEQGLLVLGAFSPESDELNRIAPGSMPGSIVVLAGNAGSDMWTHFSQSPEFGDSRPDPLDRWSRRVGRRIADEVGAAVLFPFDGPPYKPFLSWARRSGRVSQSPISISIHHEHGLWHAYRFALVAPDLPAANFVENTLPSPCLSCADQPCLRACPVGAFDGSAFDSRRCTNHLLAVPEADCNTGGCLARSSCPSRPELQYVRSHAQFHMQAFKRGRKSAG